VAQEFLKHDLQTMVFANSRLHTGNDSDLSAAGESAAAGKTGNDSRYRGGYCQRTARDRAGIARGADSRRGDDVGMDAWDWTSARWTRGDDAATPERLRPPGNAPDAPDAAAEVSCAVLVASSRAGINSSFAIRTIFSGIRRSMRSYQSDRSGILINHLKCVAAFELPIGPQEKFGEVERAGFVRAAG